MLALAARLALGAKYAEMMKAGRSGKRLYRSRARVIESLQAWCLCTYGVQISTRMVDRCRVEYRQSVKADLNGPPP